MRRSAATSVEGVALLFAIGLLFSGFASTAVGSYAGSVVMADLLRRQVPVFARRLVTATPALFVLALGVDPTGALMLSQVVLSIGIPFALIPLVVLTSRERVMGVDRNHSLTVLAASTVCVAIVGLNIALLALSFFG
ncbi:divalent metal cation transporter [Streptomyces sp. B21-108]|jgi:manganese transport protein|uniref:divalent metal cation transporter n=1 Tax=Streptomyces sp. B21-108 TaxID=3039419 RepID=UPI002FF2CADC